MTPLLMIALQSAPAQSAAATPPGRHDAQPVEFDLRTYRPSDPCRDSAASNDIVVCGRRPGGAAYPLDKMSKIFEPGPLDAETGLFGTARGRAYVEEVAMPGGQVSKRVMIGIKLPF